ncbi:IPT/TIG domain-containing protein [Mucilaginibacter sp. HD30]
MTNPNVFKKLFLALVCSSIFLAFGCKKDKQADVDPATQPTVTTMRYEGYDGQAYSNDFYPFYYYNPFILNNLGKPNSEILINGHNFSQDFTQSKVLFNNISANVTGGDSTRIFVVIPDNIPPGPVTLTINTNGKSIVHPTKFTVEKPSPQISGLNNEGGMPGSKVIIYGIDLSSTVANNKVTINGVSATVDSASVSAVYFTVPTGVAGAGKITLTTHGVTLTYKNDFNATSSSFSIINPGIKNFGLNNLALDAAGNIYGTYSNSVYKVSPNGTSSLFAQIPASADAIPYIAGCAVDKSGNIYIASPYVAVPSRASIQINGPAKVYKISPQGNMTVFAGGNYTGNVNGTGANALFFGPRNLAFDAAGNLVVNDQTSIRKITPDGLVSTFANTGGGIAMAVDAKNDDIYAIEASGGPGNNINWSARIKKISAQGTVSIPGINPLPDALSGGLFPDVSQFFRTGRIHLAVDASGDLIAVMGNNVYSIKNSTITNTFLNPTTQMAIGMALDAAGKLYLTLPSGNNERNDNYVIYKIKP